MVGQNEKLQVAGIGVQTLPAYNTNKYREPGKFFHPKEAGGVSYVLDISGIKIYHAGDTDHTVEMKELKPDLAFMPVSGTYVMTAEEAVQAVAEMKPKLAIPMHYGDVVGDVKDAEKFKAKASCEARILQKE